MEKLYEGISYEGDVKISVSASINRDETVYVYLPDGSLDRTTVGHNVTIVTRKFFPDGRMTTDFSHTVYSCET